MRSSLYVLLACAACAPKKSGFASVTRPQDDTFVVTAPVCRVNAVGQDFLLAVNTRMEGALEVSVIWPSGEMVNALRARLNANSEQELRVPAEALRQGLNQIEVAVVVDGRPFRWTRTDVTVIAERAQLSDEDGDGDCYSPRTGDCDDTNASVRPFAEDACGDGVDGNCNGVSDRDEPGCIDRCPDLDGDGASSAFCGGPDCDDADPMVRRGAAERCNGADDDCDGEIDETFDRDGDGFIACDDPGAPLPSKRVTGEACPPGYTTCVDCNDRDPQVHPGPHGTPFGTCGNGIWDPGEECEDSNSIAGDGCDPVCQVECPAGDGTTRIGAQDPLTHTCYTVFRAQQDNGINDLHVPYFNNAAEQCVTTFGPRSHLVYIETALERQFLFYGPLGPFLQDLGLGLYDPGNSATTGLWLGLSDTVNEGQFTWLNGVPLDPALFTWAVNEPDNGLNPYGSGTGTAMNDHDCVVLRDGANWPTLSDRSCFADRAAVLCETPAIAPECPP